MKFIDRHTVARVLLLAVGGLSLLAVRAHAQDAAGRFSLDSTAHWGRATLPAGKYEYFVDYSTPSAMIMLRKISGTPEGYMFVPQSSSPADPAQADGLVLTQVDGQRFVSSVTVQNLEIVFHYSVPEAKPKAKAAELIEERLVSSDRSGTR
jgi:hypothetical protein